MLARMARPYQPDPPWTCAGCGQEQGGPNGYGHRGINDHIACLNARIGMLTSALKTATDDKIMLEQEVAPFRKIRAEVAEVRAKYPERLSSSKRDATA